jgi:hypothetical protein
VIAHKNSLKGIVSAALVIAIATAPNAFAAPKVVVVKQAKLIASDATAEGATITDKAIITFSNVTGKSADIVIRAIDFTGTQLWSKTIDSGWDEVATAICVDSQGSIWLGGNSASAPVIDSATASVGALNPDAVVLEDLAQLRPDMKAISLWQLSATGDLLSQTSVVPDAPALVDALSANSSGVSILISGDTGQSLLTVKSGTFGKELKLGTIKSNFKSLLRAGDASNYLFGSSSESIGSKKLVGKVDGILLKISKAGAIASVVRSSATKAVRGWQSATSSLFLSGVVATNTTTETALTKFNSSFKPIWTSRYPSTGKSLAALGSNGSVYAIFEPTKVIKGIAGLKVIKGQSDILQFDSKGALIGAFTNSLLNNPISAGYSTDGGLIILNGDGSILQVPAR